MLRDAHEAKGRPCAAHRRQSPSLFRRSCAPRCASRARHSRLRRGHLRRSALARGRRDVVLRRSRLGGADLAPASRARRHSGRARAVRASARRPGDRGGSRGDLCLLQGRRGRGARRGGPGDPRARLLDRRAPDAVASSGRRARGDAGARAVDSRRPRHGGRPADAARARPS